MDFEKLLRSSANPEKVGMTVKGFMVGFFPLVVMVAALLGVNLPEGLVTNLIEAVGGFVTAGVAFLSTAMILFGTVRKIYLALTKG